MRCLSLFLLLPGCMSIGGSANSEPELAAELGGRVAGPPQSCVSQPQGASLQIVSDDTLVYREGRTIWVNRLRAPCLGLREDRQLVVEAGLAGRYCSGDRIRAVDFATGYSGQTCPLGDFVPYRTP